jgi:hypothetical protein
MTAKLEYIDIHGKPVAFYSGTTQFGRALRDLSIELICANSSQAKGALSVRTRRCRTDW